MAPNTVKMPQQHAGSSFAAPRVLRPRPSVCSGSGLGARARATRSPAVEGAALPPVMPTRRQMMLQQLPVFAAAASVLLGPTPAGAEETAVVVKEDTPGVGEHPVQLNDLVLFHYTGTIEATGEVFDTTRGLGLMYRDGGPGALRPLALRLGGYPLPGICTGLQSALIGMRVGGRRTVILPPEQAFGAAAAAAPYAIVPPNSTVRYEIELLRLSRRGPDALMAGLSKCSQGGASATTENCADIPPAEFV